MTDRILTVLVVDDEPLVRERMVQLLNARDDIRVVGTAADGREALEEILRTTPDLVFLDIQMPELTGFQVLAALADEHRPEIVFVTAYDEFALDAFEVNAVDYILKPIRPDRLEEAVERVFARVGTPRGAHPDLQALADWVRAEPKHLDRFVVRSRGRYHFVPAEDVDWIEGSANYLILHAAGKKHMVRATMTAAETRLDPGTFLRVHRSFIVNLTRIVNVEALGHGEYVLTMPHEGSIRTSRSYGEVVRGLLSGLE